MKRARTRGSGDVGGALLRSPLTPPASPWTPSDRRTTPRSRVATPGPDCLEHIRSPSTLSTPMIRSASHEGSVRRQRRVNRTLVAATRATQMYTPGGAVKADGAGNSGARARGTRGRAGSENPRQIYPRAVLHRRRSCAGPTCVNSPRCETSLS